MNIGLSHIGASPQGMALAKGQQASAMAAADRMRTAATRAVTPAVKLVETPAQIRAQVMAERGVDRLTLMRLGAQARIEAEISINAEAAQRAQQAQIRTTGNFVDLSV